MKSQIITLALIIVCTSTATLSLLFVPSEFTEPSVDKIIHILLLFSASIASGIIANKVGHDSR